MSRAPNDVISRTVAEVVRAAGFRGGPTTWRRAVPVGIAVVNLQKSQWGDQFYVNLGLYVRALGTNESPKEYECHYRVRAESLDAQRKSHWRSVLDLEQPWQDDVRREELLQLLTVHGLPLLESVGSEEGLRAAASRGTLTQAIRGELSRHLGLT